MEIIVEYKKVLQRKMNV